MLDQAVGGVENGLGGAVVFLQPDDLGIREKFFKLEDVGDLRSAPAIDRLIVIADDADMVGRADKLLQQAHLQGVGVLELVHGDPCIKFTKMVADVGVLPQDLLGEKQQVVEIHGVLRAQFVLIGDGDGCVEIVWKVRDIDGLVFGFRNLAQHVFGFYFLIGATLAHEELLHDADLVGKGADGEVLLVA